MKNSRNNSRGVNTRGSHRNPVTRTGNSQGQWIEEHDGNYVHPKMRNTVRTSRPTGTHRTGNGNFVEPTWTRNTSTVNDVTYPYPTGRTGGQRFRSGNMGWSRYGNYTPTNTSMNMDSYDDYVDHYEEDEFLHEDEFIRNERPVRTTFRSTDPYNTRGSWSNEEEIYDEDMVEDTYGDFEESFVDEGYITDRGYTTGGYPVNERYPVSRGTYNGPRETTREFIPTRRVKVPVSRGNGQWRSSRNTRY